MSILDVLRSAGANNLQRRSLAESARQFDVSRSDNREANTMRSLAESQSAQSARDQALELERLRQSGQLERQQLVGQQGAAELGTRGEQARSLEEMSQAGALNLAKQKAELTPVKPEFRNLGDKLLMLDPNTGQSSVVAQTPNEVKTTQTFDPSTMKQQLEAQQVASMKPSKELAAQGLAEREGNILTGAIKGAKENLFTGNPFMGAATGAAKEFLFPKYNLSESGKSLQEQAKKQISEGGTTKTTKVFTGQPMQANNEAMTIPRPEEVQSEEQALSLMNEYEMLANKESLTPQENLRALSLRELLVSLGAEA